MKSFKKLLILASVVAAYNSAYAQNSYSGYFLDNYTYRYRSEEHTSELQSQR